MDTPAVSSIATLLRFLAQMFGRKLALACLELHDRVRGWKLPAWNDPCGQGGDSRHVSQMAAA